MKRSKGYRQAAEKIDATELHTPLSAVRRKACRAPSCRAIVRAKSTLFGRCAGRVARFAFEEHPMSSNPTPARPPIRVSRLDVERIESLLEQPQYRALDTAALQDELVRAEVLEPARMPNDVITMNSVAQVQVTDADGSRQEHELTLVFPRDADADAHRVSILAPVGSALLGLRVGDVIDWPMPGGRSARLQVLAVRYQPEAAGELHR